MSNTTKTLIGIAVVIVVVGGGIWWWMAAKNNATGINPAMTANQTSTAGSPSPSTTVVETSTSWTSTNDSDASINAEMTAANSQMNGFSSDTASINQGMNDQPVPQGQ